LLDHASIVIIAPFLSWQPMINNSLTKICVIMSSR
jgi:hypothetical protein